MKKQELESRKPALKTQTLASSDDSYPAIGGRKWTLYRDEDWNAIKFGNDYSRKRQPPERAAIVTVDGAAPKLPLEIWKLISQHLHKNTYLLRVRRVCIHWRAMGSELLALRDFDLDGKMERNYRLYCCSSKGRNIWERDLYVNRHYALEQFTLYIKEPQQFLFRSHYKQWDDDGRSFEIIKHARGTYEWHDAFRTYSNSYDGFKKDDYYQEIVHQGQQMEYEFRIDNLKDEGKMPIQFNAVSETFPHEWRGKYYLAVCDNLGIKIDVHIDCARYNDPDSTIPLFWETLIRDDNITLAQWLNAVKEKSASAHASQLQSVPCVPLLPRPWPDPRSQIPAPRSEHLNYNWSKQSECFTAHQTLYTKEVLTYSSQ